MQNYLDLLRVPADLRKLPPEVLPQLCQELRQFIIHAVAQNGGHLGASLGVIELTVALHYLFDTPNDQLIWDVGHQAYGHKILTDRKECFETNRKWNGIAGFPDRSESIFDAFGTGHSSTSISAALGLAQAFFFENKKNHAIAVIGDGSMTSGLAFEALNNADPKLNVLIVLNDNGMSIDPNVGNFKHHLDTIGTQKPNFFENLGISYTGVVDGHNLEELLLVLEKLKKQNGLKLVHIRTIKGKGYNVAENDQVTWHAPGTFNKVSGVINAKQVEEAQKPPLKYQDVFGHTLTELAEKNEKIVGITPAMLSGSSLRIMKNRFPERVFDVGIAEQHAVTFAAGLAANGMKVFCSLYATFLQRAYDQLIHDVCLQNLSVIFCLDRAGLVGEDGATHQGVFDLAFLRCIPNLIIAAPVNEHELRNLLFTAQLPDFDKIMAIRYPRGKGVLENWQNDFEKTEIGKGKMLRKGKKVAVLSIGHIGNLVLKIAGNFSHYDMGFVKPLDEQLLHHIFSEYEQILTIEDGALMGGFGSAILEFASLNSYFLPICRLGVPDQFIKHGKIEQQQDFCGLSVEKIRQTIQNLSIRSYT